MNAKQLRLDLDRLRSEVKQMEAMLRTAQRNAEKAFVPCYRIANAEYGSNSFDRIHCLRITLKATDESIAEHASLLATYGSFASMDNNLHSVGYLGQDGYLIHIGGGWLLLDEHERLTDGEFDLLKAGDFSTIKARLSIGKKQLVE